VFLFFLASVNMKIRPTSMVPRKWKENLFGDSNVPIPSRHFGVCKPPNLLYARGSRALTLTFSYDIPNSGMGACFTYSPEVDSIPMENFLLRQLH